MSFRPERHRSIADHPGIAERPRTRLERRGNGKVSAGSDTIQTLGLLRREIVEEQQNVVQDRPFCTVFCLTS
jgi:hypothetical protein